MNKSNTDRHWNDRALSESDDARVNIADTVQRDLELQFIFSQLPADAQVLEVGCGNGYVTRQLRERVRHVDAFDYAENMVARGRANYGETNNRFFHGSVLDPPDVVTTTGWVPVGVATSTVVITICVEVLLPIVCAVPPMVTLAASSTVPVMVSDE